jgi:hypothetical protein
LIFRSSSHNSVAAAVNRKRPPETVPKRRPNSIAQSPSAFSSVSHFAPLEFLAFGLMRSESTLLFASERISLAVDRIEVAHTRFRKINRLDIAQPIDSAENRINRLETMGLSMYVCNSLDDLPG